eukprot:Awhi_evm1s7192
MGHPPEISSNLSFENFINEIINKIINVENEENSQKSRKIGLKVDFKHECIVKQCLMFLSKVSESSHAFAALPLWLNADILQGPGGPEPAFDSHVFIEACVDHLPDATLSL